MTCFLVAMVCLLSVSMKSGLEGRNNIVNNDFCKSSIVVSMKSGLEGRNNPGSIPRFWTTGTSLNEVRPRRPEQSAAEFHAAPGSKCLNEVRPRRPEQ